MTKRQLKQWERYVSSLERYGRRDLGHAYKSFSLKKYRAWDDIRKRVSAEKGFGFTVTSAGSHYFSTDYVRRVNSNPMEYEWVHDSASGTTRIPFEAGMVGELKLAGVYDPGSW